LPAERPVNAPVDACSAKIFSRGSRQHVDFSAHRKTRHNGAAAAHPCRTMQKSKAAKTLKSSAFLPCVDGVGAMLARRKFFAAPALP
jgi:hypothetical protein